ncbi:DUF1028 domain-containing protein [Denitrobaculum tricleocarpae]|uniref:DUF1028 domain-containing protein n=1 Tax=Denitrobaculum tricleocarpae TaxID=2591009 RepID=A0A545TXF3_9PROT|nr:DUF1028 domain-containing protein [Denitrobaculum tricleocarpae]TQV81851.1 DUF1028 domain-containing protein [Denitrobaculum tricleocarpae]
MTWSIVARDPESGDLGIAVASRFFAVGSRVPHLCSHVGAVATQAFVNPHYGIHGLVMLAEGKSPEEIVASLTAADEGRDSRQLHMIDARGRSAAFTGSACVDWAGHLLDDQVSVAGNMLAGPAVIEETLKSYQAHPELPLLERLLGAMEAGEAAGGDKRGKQSAAVQVYRGEAYPWLDLRADDHADPLAELRRLYAVAQERYLHFAEAIPTAANPSGLTDRTELDKKLQALEEEQQKSGYRSASFANP